jgi:hypothetical protein
MIPLIGRVKELENQKAIVVRIANEVLKAAGMKKLRYMVGTMIEIPRAALINGRFSGEGSRVLQLWHERFGTYSLADCSRRLPALPNERVWDFLIPASFRAH